MLRGNTTTNFTGWLINFGNKRDSHKNENAIRQDRKLNQRLLKKGTCGSKIPVLQLGGTRTTHALLWLSAGGGGRGRFPKRLLPSLNF